MGGGPQDDLADPDVSLEDPRLLLHPAAVVDQRRDPRIRRSRRPQPTLGGAQCRDCEKLVGGASICEGPPIGFD
jgi:hypothetical protein